MKRDIRVSDEIIAILNRWNNEYLNISVEESKTEEPSAEDLARIEEFKKKGWIKSDKKPALNPDLWEELLALTQRHEVHYHWVKGHAENPKNNRCDELAVAQWKKIKEG